MRSIRHWTPRYIVDRTRLAVFQWRAPESPWLTRTMIRLLQDRLRPEHRGFEWGAGNSTSWFSCRTASLVSIEHSPYWHGVVQRRLQDKRIRNVDLRLLESASDYVQVARQFGDATFDYVLVDGVERDRCAVEALRLVKPGGLLILDNSNWYVPTDSRTPFSRPTAAGPETQYWKQFLDVVSAWPITWTTNGVWDGCWWIRPDASSDQTPSDTVESIRTQ